MDEGRVKYLIHAVANEGNQTAFEELHRIYFSGLLSFSVSIVKDRHLSEEIINDVFVNLWTNRNTLLTIKSLSNYLYIAVKHASLNAIKSSSFTTLTKRTVLGEPPEEHYSYMLYTPEELLISNQNLKLISEAINTLPPKCRLVFRLIKEEGLKYKEVAELLGISAKTVQNHMIKAMSLIVSKLKELFPEHYRKYGS